MHDDETLTLKAIKILL